MEISMAVLEEKSSECRCWNTSILPGHSGQEGRDHPAWTHRWLWAGHGVWFAMGTEFVGLTSMAL